MATALAKGIHQAAGDDLRLIVADPNEAARKNFVESLSNQADVAFADSNRDVLEQSDVVLLAVKPQYLVEALDFAPLHDRLPLFVSVVAGASIQRIGELTQGKRIIRVMPNTPCLIGEGVSAICPSDDTPHEDIQLITNYLCRVGEVVRVRESMMDAVTGLSGSGPAFVFTFIESLIDSGVLEGLSRADATRLAVQTVIGSAKLIKATGEHPAILRDRVTSPGGTTIAGMKALEDNGFRKAVISAVAAATERSRNL
jgi:pyrroline-5-carboxylate reductase